MNNQGYLRRRGLWDGRVGLSIFWIATLVLSLLSSPSVAVADEEGEDLGRQKGLPEKRVLTPEAGEFIQSTLESLQSSHVLKGWMAEVAPPENLSHARVLAYTAIEDRLGCFEFLLEDLENSCSGHRTKSWCVNFVQGQPSEWAQKKHAEHKAFGKNALASIWLSGGPPAAVQKAIVSGFLSVETQVIESGGAADPYAKRSEPGRTGSPENVAVLAAFRGFDSFNRVLVLLEVLLALGLFLFFVFSRLNVARWKPLFAWLCLTVGALLIRVFAVEHVVFHENHHGYHYIRAIISGLEGTFGLPSSFIILMHPLALFTGGYDESVFLWNAIFSALTCPLLGHLVIRLTRSQTAGWAAALMLAITPHAIRMAPTATYFNFVAFALIAATLATIFALEEVDKRGVKAWPSVLMATALILISAQSRVLTLVFPIGIGILVFGAGVIASRRQKIAIAVMGAGVGVLLVNQVFGLLNAMRENPVAGEKLISPFHNFEKIGEFVLFDPAVVSPALGVLALFGVAALFRGPLVSHSLNQARAIVLGILFFVGVAGSVGGVYISRIRFEIPANALLTGIAGLGIAMLMAHASKVHKGVSIFVGAALILSAVAPHAFLKKAFPDALEYAFLTQEVLPGLRAEMADGPTVLVVPRPPTESIRDISSSWWARQAPNVPAPATYAEAVEEGADEIGKQGIYVYIGLECYWADAHPKEGIPEEHVAYCPAPFVEGAPQIHPNCASALAGSKWRKVITRVVTTEEAKGSCVSLKPYEVAATIGLFRSTEDDPSAVVLTGPDCLPAGEASESTEGEGGEVSQENTPPAAPLAGDGNTGKEEVGEKQEGESTEGAEKEVLPEKGSDESPSPTNKETKEPAPSSPDSAPGTPTLVPDTP